MSIVSIGYSALSSSLMVTGEANFRVREDVRITGIKVINPETANGGYETYPAEYYKDGTKVMVILPETNSTVTYEVEITNNTGVSYYLKSKTDALATNPSMQYTISGLEINTTEIKAKTTTTFTITVSYKSGVALPSDKNVTFETKFVFDILDVTPPTVSFNPKGGEYKEFQTVTIIASDEHYDHMDVEVQNSNGKIEEKSQTNIKATTFEVSLDNYDSYKILVKAYDQRGNTQTDTPLDGNEYTYQEYVIKKPGVNFAEYLKSQANSSSITSYQNGKKQEMYTFSHSSTSQTSALTDYRYIGDSPNNYVYFNCQDDSQVSTCETWRIIGVFSVENEKGKIEDRVKIIRDSCISGILEWDSNEVNDWNNATLKTYLNEVYYKELSITARAMIDNAKYYLGGSNDKQGMSGENYYISERGNTVYGSHSKNWTGNIGLVYTSDYVYTYANNVDSSCYKDVYNCSKGNPSAGWLFQVDYQWQMTPSSSDSNKAFRMEYDGNVRPDGVGGSFSIRPVLYLASNVSKIGGTGNVNDPYIIEGLSKDFPPEISFSSPSGTYYTSIQITTTVEDDNYSYMNVEVRNSNGRMENKSQNNITENTYTVILDEYDTYTIFVTAYDKGGNITEGEKQYVIKEPGVNAVQKLKEKINSDNVTSYGSGDKTQMFTFSHAATRQTGALTDYRYIGNTPNNYVYFNCKSEPATNCETWRIIGIFSVDDGKGNIEERMKIIKDASIVKNNWDSGGVNNWETASLNYFLNEMYYFGSLSDTAKAMIGDTKYYLGGGTSSYLSGPSCYEFERGTTVYDTSRPIYWVGKIALMYPSDYVYTYALGVDDTCYRSGNNCPARYGGSPSKGWLFSGYDEWTLSPSNLPDNVFHVYSDGSLFGNDLVMVQKQSYEVRPALYLSSSVLIVDGDGSSGNPYQLAI